MYVLIMNTCIWYRNYLMSEISVPSINYHHIHHQIIFLRGYGYDQRPFDCMCFADGFK